MPQLQKSVTTTTTTLLSGSTPPVINLNNNNNISSNSQIIPEQHHLSRRNKEYFDIRLKENFKIFISGPSRSGKTVFVKNLLQKLSIFSKSPPKLVTLVYKIYQPIYDELNLSYIIEDGPNLKEKIINLSKGESNLIIFDDCINSPQLSEISDFFLVDGRHRNLSCIFISQKIFINNNHFREITQNSDYFIVFKNPRNIQEIRTLNSQMTPGGTELISYYKLATSEPFSYLFINLTQECRNEVKYLSHLFNETHYVTAYLNNTSKKLTDEENNEYTDFGQMFFKIFNVYHPLSTQYKAVQPGTRSTPRFGTSDNEDRSAQTDITSINSHKSVQSDPISTPDNVGRSAQTNISSINSHKSVQTNPLSTALQDRVVQTDSPSTASQYKAVLSNLPARLPSGTQSEAVSTVVQPYRVQDIHESPRRTYRSYRLQTIEQTPYETTPQSRVQHSPQAIISSDDEDMSESKVQHSSQTIIGSDDDDMSESSGTQGEVHRKRRKSGERMEEMQIKDETSKRGKSDNIQPYSLYEDNVRLQIDPSIKFSSYTKKEKCFYCQSFDHKKGCILHVSKTGRISKLQRFRCKICSITTRSELGLKNHMKKIHHLRKPTQRKLSRIKYKCNICQNFFQSEDALKLHTSLCQVTASMVKKKQKLSHKVLKCGICGDIFQSKNALKAHYRSCKPTVFACTICGKNFELIAGLKRHMKSMHGNYGGKF